MTAINYPVISPKEIIKCKKCAAEISLFNPLKYEVVSCTRCFTIHTKNENSNYGKIPNRWENSSKVIPLYTKCTLEDRELTIIGCVLKEDLYTEWYEYQLIDRNSNSYTLSQWEGHYHFFKPVHETELYAFQSVNLNSTEIVYNEKKFIKLSKYKPKTICLIGEFNYDVVDVRNSYCVDFIHPPEIITFEKNGNLKSFFSGNYLNKNEINQFIPDVSVEIHDRTTAGMAQPFFHGFRLQKFNKLVLGFVLLLTVLHIVLLSNFSEYSILRLKTEDTTSGIEKISNSFELKEKTGNYYLQFSASAYLDNQWIEDQIVLVNEVTGEEREFSVGLEYYSGVDGGYHWTEGSNEVTVFLSGVKPGRYHLKEKFVSSTTSNVLFYLTVYVSTPSNWNFGIIAAICLLAFLVFNYLNAKFEEKRTGEPHGIFSEVFKSKYK